MEKKPKVTGNVLNGMGESFPNLERVNIQREGNSTPERPTETQEGGACSIRGRE